MTQLVSLIIPNWNQRQLLSECISSICSTMDGMPHEIIVVDNASTDGSKEYIQKQYPETIWVQNSRNLGYAKAINQGVQHAKGGFLFLMNNDIKLLQNTCETLVTLLKTVPDAGAVAPLLFYPDGRLQISCRRFPTPLAVLLEKLNIERFGRHGKLKMTINEHLTGGVVEQPMSSALLIRKECWEAVGPLDEQFPIFFNDVDWCYRLYRKAHYKIYLCPEAKAIHHEGATANLLGFRKKIEFYKGLMRFYSKHFIF